MGILASLNLVDTFKMLGIIPILIRVSAVALSRGAGVAIGRWAGGSVAKKYIATTVVKKAIEEGKKMALNESQRWQDAFKEDPAEAMRGAAAEFINNEARDLISQKSEISIELVTTYRQKLIQEVGREIMQRSDRQNGRDNTILELDGDAASDRAVESVLAQGLALESFTQRMSKGNSDGLGRSLATYADNPIKDEEVIRASARSAYTNTIDDRALTYTVIGKDDLFMAKVRSPLEAILEKAMDVSEPARL